MATLTIRRGDTRVWTLTLRNAAGNLQSLSGLSVWWTVRSSTPVDPTVDTGDADAVMKAWWAHNGAAVTSSGVTGPDGAAGGSFVAPSPANGQMTLTLLPRLTTKLPMPSGGALWKYDVQLRFGSDDDIRTWDEGSVTLVPDVTRRTVTP